MASAQQSTTTSPNPVGDREPTPTPSYTKWILIALTVAILSYLVSFFVLKGLQQPPGGYKLAASFNLLSGLTVVTLGLERLLEPVRLWWGPDTEAKKNELANASTQAQASAPLAVSFDVATKQAAVDTTRRETAILMWGIASAAGFLIAAGTNVLLLHSIAAPGSTLPPPSLDLLLTGLIIGAGTKPVHDLVSRIEKSKTSAEDKAARSTSAPGPATSSTP